MTSHERLTRGLPRVFLALLLGACAGLTQSCSSGSSSSNAAPATATPASTASQKDNGARVFLQDSSRPQQTTPLTVTDSQSGSPLFQMSALRVTVAGAQLRDAEGRRVPLQLAADASAVEVDVMALNEGSTLLALGEFPAGTYTGLTLTVVGVEMVGTNQVTGQAETQPVAQRSTQIDASFDPPLMRLDPAQTTTIVVDMSPVVEATVQSGAPIYSLASTVDAFVPGTGSRIGLDSRLEGQVTRSDSRQLTVGAHGFNTAIDVTPTTQYSETRAPQPGQLVTVTVKLPEQQGNPFTATEVNTSSPASPPVVDPAAFCGVPFQCQPGVNRHANVMPSRTLVAERITANATTGYVEFFIRENDTFVGYVVTDDVTKWDGISGPAGLQPGMILDVDGCPCQDAPDPVTGLLYVLADEVSVIGQTASNPMANLANNQPPPTPAQNTPTTTPAAPPTPVANAPVEICGALPACPPGVDRHGDIYGNPRNLKVAGVRTNSRGFVEFDLFNTDTSSIVANVTTDNLTSFHNISGASALQNGMLVDVDGCICEPPTTPMDILADEVDVVSTSASP